VYGYTRGSTDVASYKCRNIKICNIGDAEWKILGYCYVRRR
jgi:hypothetical protein